MNILHYLNQAEAGFSSKTALEDDKEKVTYSELKQRAESIGTAVAERIGKINSPVIVMIDRNAASVCAFLGIVESHNFYVPVDAGQPIERIKVIFSEIQPALVITIYGNLPSGLELTDIPVLEYDVICSHTADRSLLAARQKDLIDTDPLYAICTSGSTGVPKGVLISHRCVLDFIPVFTKTFGLTSDDIFGNQAPFDFDVSVKDLYSALYLGATVYIIPKVCFVMPKKLVEVLDEKKVTTIIWAVSALCIAAGVNAFKSRVPGYLSKIMFSGEVMPIRMLNIWRSYYPNAMFVNLYGPTEITCNCSYYMVDREFGENEKLPIGVSFENEDMFVLNENNQKVAPGETGEICVRGTCVALGYYNNPERTRAAFVQNPLNDKYPEVIYRTGDLAVLAENGEYYFSGRKDFQIKHMGHRIELEEIEANINAVPGVIRACCLFDENRNKIAAFYTGDAEKGEIIGDMKKRLPKYMIPNIFTRFGSLPMTKNGKIDRKKLKMYYETGLSPISDYSEFQELYGKIKERIPRPDTNCMLPGSILRESIRQGGLYYREFPEGLVLYADEGDLYRVYYFLDGSKPLPDMSCGKRLLIEEPDSNGRRKEYIDRFTEKAEQAGFSLTAYNYQFEIDLAGKEEWIRAEFADAEEKIKNNGFSSTCEPTHEQALQVLELWKEYLKPTDIPAQHLQFETDQDQFVVCVLDSAGNVCGTNWWGFRGNLCEVRHTVTHPDHYRKGIAKYMILYCFVKALDTGYGIAVDYADEHKNKSFGLLHDAGMKENGKVSLQFVLETEKN